MQKLLIDKIKEHTPKMNPNIANGLACHYMKDAEAYIDSVFRAVLVNIPGFEYVGMTHVSPTEEFSIITKPRRNKRIYDIAKSDTYMVKVTFRFNGKLYSKHIQLPFLSEGGTMHLRGAKYAISPVLADRVISITPPNIFVRLLRDRLNFTKAPYFYISNTGAYYDKPDGKRHYEDIRETVSVVSSVVYKKKESLKQNSKMFNLETNLVFYLLCKYGCTEMFKQFTQVDVKYIHTDQVHTVEAEQYVICQTTGIKPKTLNKSYYVPSKIALLIPRQQYTESVRNLVAGVFYVLDHFSEEVKIEDMDRLERWRVCMGMSLWGHEVNSGKLYDDLSDHINSLDNYIDETMKIEFRGLGLPIDNIYQMFYILIDKFNEWQLSHINNEANLYGKKFSVLSYVLLSIIEQIVLFYFKMTKDSKPTPNKLGLTENDVLNNITRRLNPKAVLSMYRDSPFASIPASASDNMIPAITQLLVPQSKTSKRQNSSGVSLKDPSIRLHVSIALVCTHLLMSKTHPSGDTRLNMYLDIDPQTDMPVIPEDLADLLSRTQSIIDEGRMA